MWEDDYDIFYQIFRFKVICSNVWLRVLDSAWSVKRFTRAKTRRYERIWRNNRGNGITGNLPSVLDARVCLDDFDEERMSE